MTSANSVEVLANLLRKMDEQSQTPKPSFHGDNAQMFMTEYEQWCARNSVKKEDKIKYFSSCASGDHRKLIENHSTIRHNGQWKCVKWEDLKQWFLKTYAQTEDADSLVRAARDAINHRDSYMRPDESLSDFLSRFATLIHNIDTSREIWNAQNEGIDENDKLKRVSKLEKNIYFLDRLNATFSSHARYKHTTRTAWDVIITDLKVYNSTLHNSNRFRPIASPGETISSVGSPSDMAKILAQLEQQRKLLAKQEKLTKALMTGQVKNASFTPLNAVGTYPGPNGHKGSNPGDSNRCTLCGTYGHTSPECTQMICSKCSGKHLKSDCEFKHVDLWCDKCHDLGHVSATCPYRFTDAPSHRINRTRGEVTIEYRRYMNKLIRRGPIMGNPSDPTITMLEVDHPSVIDNDKI